MWGFWGAAEGTLRLWNSPQRWPGWGGGESEARVASFTVPAPRSGDDSATESPGPESAHLRSQLGCGASGGSGPFPASVSISVQWQSWAQESPGQPPTLTCPDGAAVLEWGGGEWGRGCPGTCILHGDPGKPSSGGDSESLNDENRPLIRGRETQTGRCRVGLGELPTTPNNWH